jgi:two-component system response regulator AtoC
MKVGGEKVLKTEARIIAATNQNLKVLIEKGRFREDLFYRLKVVEITLPSLRERREDIPDLVAYLLEKINRELRRSVRKVPPDVMKILSEMPWRGNVRELENALTRAVILAKGDVVLKENLPLEPDERRTFSDELVSLEEVEKKYIPSSTPSEQDPGQPGPADQPPDPRQEDQGIRARDRGSLSPRPFDLPYRLRI